MLKETDVYKILRTVTAWEKECAGTIIAGNGLSLKEVFESSKAPTTPSATAYVVEEVELSVNDANEAARMVDQYAKKIQKAYKELEQAKANAVAWEKQLNSLCTELLETQSALAASLQKGKTEAILEAEIEIANTVLGSLIYRIDTAKAEIQRYHRSIKSTESNIHQYERLMNYWLERESLR